MEEYTKEFFWNTYKTLPEELKEAIFDENNNQIIYNACSKLGLTEEQTSLVSKYTGRVLMGLLSLKDFNVTLELELNIDEVLANKIYREIDASIFKHLRLALSRIEEQKFGGQPEKHKSFLDELIPPAESEKPSQSGEAPAPSLKTASEILDEEGIIDDIQFPKIKMLFRTPAPAPLPRKSVTEPAISQKDVLIDLSDQPQQTFSAPPVNKPANSRPRTLTIEPLGEIKENKPAPQVQKSTESQPLKVPITAKEFVASETKPVSEPVLTPKPAPVPEPVIEKTFSEPQEKTPPPPKKSAQFDPYREVPL